VFGEHVQLLHASTGWNGTFDTGRFPFKGTGATLFRCYSTGADNGGRFDSDCTMQECFVENLIADH
jgi:hypothetical protein